MTPMRDISLVGAPETSQMLESGYRKTHSLSLNILGENVRKFDIISRSKYVLGIGHEKDCEKDWIAGRRVRQGSQPNRREIWLRTVVLSDVEVPRL